MVALHHPKSSAAAMDPPEERVPVDPSYNIGDMGASQHMASFPTSDENLMAVARLRPNDPCFVLRTCGGYSFARVLSRDRNGLEVRVNNEGSTKTIPTDQWAKYIRILKLGSPPSSSSPTYQQPKRRVQRKPSEAFSQSFTGGARPSLQRRSSVENIGDMGSSGAGQRQGRPSLRRQASLNASFQSCLARNEGRNRPSLNSRQASLNHRASFQSGLMYNTADGQGGAEAARARSILHASFQSGLQNNSSSPIPNSPTNNASSQGQRQHPKPQQRRRFSRRSSETLRSSILTHVPEDEDDYQQGQPCSSSWRLSDDLDEPIISDVEISSPDENDEIEGGESDGELSESSSSSSDSGNHGNNNKLKSSHPLSSGNEADHDDSDEISSSSFISDDESPRVSKPHALVIRRMGKRGSVRTVTLPGDFDDLQFNEDSLIRAFNSIVSSGTKA